MSRTRVPSGGGNDFVREHNMYDFRNTPFKTTTGNIYFVNSAGTAGSGLSPEDPCVTLNAARALTTAANGDIVYVMEGHAESIVAAGTFASSKSGVSYIGLGNGRNRPVITFSALTSAQMTVSAANCTFRNLVFDFTGIDAIVAAISVTGADVAFEDCEFICQSATITPILGILTAATATRFRVERCRFLGVKTTSSGSTLLGMIKHEVGEDFLIKDCHFEGKGTQLINNATAVNNGLITNCTFHIYTGTIGVNAHANSQFWVNGCSFVAASGTAPIVGTKVNVTGNKYTTEGIGISAGSAGTF